MTYRMGHFNGPSKGHSTHDTFTISDQTFSHYSAIKIIQSQRFSEALASVEHGELQKRYNDQSSNLSFLDHFELSMNCEFMPFNSQPSSKIQARNLFFFILILLQFYCYT